MESPEDQKDIDAGSEVQEDTVEKIEESQEDEKEDIDIEEIKEDVDKRAKELSTAIEEDITNNKTINKELMPEFTAGLADVAQQMSNAQAEFTKVLSGPVGGLGVNTEATPEDTNETESNDEDEEKTEEEQT